MTVCDIRLPEPITTETAQAYCVQLAEQGDKLALPPSGYVSRAAYALCLYQDGIDGEQLCQALLDDVKVSGQPMEK